MPVYEYECVECEHVTEVIRRMSDADGPQACEACGSDQTTRKHSVFMAGAASEARGYAPPRSDAGGCGHCGGAPGSCMM